MTPSRFEARVRSALRALAAGSTTEDEAAADICADASCLSAWWIEQAFRGERWTVSGRPVESPRGAA